MANKKTTARRDGQRASGVPGADRRRGNGIAEAAREFIEEWGRGGRCTIDVRREYAALMRRAKPHAARYAKVLREARAALDNAVARAWVPIPEGERGGLRIGGCGGIQYPRGVAVDVEVYDKWGRLLDVVTGWARSSRRLTRRQAQKVNEYLHLAGVRRASWVR